MVGDTAAAPRDVVSALLQDPLADSATTRQALISRHQDANLDVFEIRYVGLCFIWNFTTHNM